MINKRFRTQTKDLWQHTHTPYSSYTKHIVGNAPSCLRVCMFSVHINSCLLLGLCSQHEKLWNNQRWRVKGPSIISSWWCADTYHRSHLIQRVMCRVPFWDESLSFETLFSDWWPQCSINRQLICAGSSDPQAACYHFSASACSRWPYKVFTLFSLNVEIVTIHS